ncbi:MAG: MerR family transcriptional regulator [Xanthobacteraceae bacterium]|nr:MerR family transcriptional regulator [Xanthobacteraceae bacterium]QYK43688.1 MAG: MerR family transcriptional regulator [Xanthobacteraceae bacterium]
MEKGPDAFRTISEVAEDLDLPQHVLRFWETRFTQIKPMKRGGGRRYYRPDDVDLLRGIRHLLYGEGYTIRGVQQILKDQGLRYVQTVGRSAETDPARLRDVNFDDADMEAEAAVESVSAGGRGGGVVSFVAPSRPREPELPRVVEVPKPQPQQFDDDGPAIPFRKFGPAPEREEPLMPLRPRAEEQRLPRDLPREMPREVPREVARSPEPQLRSAAPRVHGNEAGGIRLSSEAVQLLKATLYELGECRRMLDSSRKGGAG